MMGVGIFGMFALVLVVLILCVVVGVVASSFKGVSLGRVTLQCPHCGKETQAQRGTCEECGKDL